MKASGIVPANADLSRYGIQNAQAHWNLSPEELSRLSLELGQAQMTSTGAITVDTGEFTGRSPKDRFIVKDALTENSVWWGDINIAFDADKFDALYNKVMVHLSSKELFVRDVYACADPAYRMDIRVINERPWSNLFAYNMFLRPTEEELVGFEPEWLVINAPGFRANPEVDGTRQHNFAILNFTRKMILIGGTGTPVKLKKAFSLPLISSCPTKRIPFLCTAPPT